jgi:hypothetical protein
MTPKQKILLPPYDTWSAAFKKRFFQRLGNYNGIRSEADMAFVKSIYLIEHQDGMLTLEIKKHKDIVEVLPADLPAKFRKYLELTKS